MIQEFLPFEWNSDMTHQLRRNHFSSSVPLNGANLKESVIGVLATLKTTFIASLPFQLKLLGFRKGQILIVTETRVAAEGLSISNELHHQFLDLRGQHGVPTAVTAFGQT